MAKTQRCRTPSPFAGVRGYYLPSTHWDREWYEPFQHFRFRLLDILGELFGLLEQPQRPLAARTRSAHVSAGAKQIVTVRLRLGVIR